VNLQRLSLAAVAGTLLAGALPVAPALADRTPADRQAYVTSGAYLAEIDAALAPARAFLIQKATPVAAQIDACVAAGRTVGTPDPGPKAGADYTVAVPAPTSALRARAATTTPTATIAAAHEPLTAKEKAAAKRKAAAKKRATAKKQAAAKKKAAAEEKKRQPKTTSPTTPGAKPVAAPAPTTPTTAASSTPAPAAAATPDAAPVYDYPPVPQPPSAAQCAAIKPMAIALDQDETAMSSYRVGTAAPQWDQLSSIRNQALGTQSRLEPIYQLYRLARSLHVSVFVITARFDPILADPSNNALYTSGALCTATYLPIGLCGVDLTKYDYRAVTADNLKSAGYTELAGLYMRPAGSTDKGVVKANQRVELIRDRGYDLLEMVGDNGSDVANGWADLMVKIPTLD
jgi:chemotaxis protein histidine kinase CheA